MLTCTSTNALESVIFTIQLLLIGAAPIALFFLLIRWWSLLPVWARALLIAGIPLGVVGFIILTAVVGGQPCPTPVLEP